MIIYITLIEQRQNWEKQESCPWNQSINHFQPLQSLHWGWNLWILLYSSCQIEAKTIPTKWKMLHLISYTIIVCLETSEIEFLENWLNLRDISLSLKCVLLWTQFHELHCAGFVFRLGAFLQLLHFPVLALCQGTFYLFINLFYYRSSSLPEAPLVTTNTTHHLWVPLSGFQSSALWASQIVRQQWPTVWQQQQSHTFFEGIIISCCSIDDGPREFCCNCLLLS